MLQSRIPSIEVETIHHYINGRLYRQVVRVTGQYAIWSVDGGRRWTLEEWPCRF